MGHQIERLLTVIGIPRSGTTLLTAVISVHSRVATIYDPFNSSKSIDSAKSLPFTEFVSRFAGGREEGMLLVKETSTRIDYLQRIDELLQTADVPGQCMVVARDPHHVFLSEMQARREWWGEQHLRVNAESFSRWSRKTLDGWRRLADMAWRHNAIMLSYDKFCESPHHLGLIMEKFGLVVEAQQWEYQDFVNKAIVRGDRGVGTDPRRISNDSVVARETEWQGLVGDLQTSDYFERMGILSQLVGQLALVASARDQETTVEQIRKLSWN